MPPQLLSLLSPLGGLALNLLIQVGLRRALGVRLIYSIFLGFCVGLLGCLGLELWNYAFYWPGTTGDFLYLLLTNLIIYGLLGYGYFHFINLGETGRRVRLVRELYLAPEGLTLEEILERYNAREIIGKRLQRLLDNQQIILREERYFIKPSLMLFITSALLGAKSFLLGEKGD